MLSDFGFGYPTCACLSLSILRAEYSFVTFQKRYEGCQRVVLFSLYLLVQMIFDTNVTECFFVKYVVSA